ncbi:MAG: D-glycero-beta-D-manno-heptose 1-phosphate adenylyltransferase [Bacteroidales bacterium]|nr:D-glycero-beta-D-manno-heptose 1-phosphate adenylyltransferase [Bacteroidales bacterium]
MSALSAIKSKITDISEINGLVSSWKSQGHSVVFTNGCFDVLHYGHVSYLAEASDLGDKLVIGLNSDASVRRLKGETRPINGQNERATLLAALDFVDAVVIFEEDTPENLLKKIKPNFLVKGGDYTFETIVGADFVSSYGGKVATIPLVENFSSSLIIKRF